MTTDKIEFIAREKIHKPWSQLRPVRKDSIEFEELKKSIREMGVLKNLLVRPSPKVEGQFEVVDGLWRFTAACELGIPVLPCRILEAPDDEVLNLQVLLNAVGYETTDLEYAKQLRAILDHHEAAGTSISKQKLASLCSKSVQWVNDRLNLTKLSSDCQLAFEEGGIKLGHAAILAGIKSHNTQNEFLPAALDLPVRMFEQHVGRMLADKHVEGTLHSRTAQVGGLRAYLRSKGEVMRELDSLEYITHKIVNEGITHPIDAAIMTLEWCLNINSEVREGYLKSRRIRLTKEEERAIIAARRYKDLEGIEEEEQTWETTKKEKLENVKQRIDHFKGRVFDSHAKQGSESCGSAESNKEGELSSTD